MSSMFSVVVAPDSFKGSASAPEAARWIAQGWRAVDPEARIVEIPLADGGEGTLDAIAAAHVGTTTAAPTTASATSPASETPTTAMSSATPRATVDVGPQMIPCIVPAPVPGQPPVETRWLYLPDGTGVIELADAAGIGRLERPAPMTASTVGLGHVIAAALDYGCRRLFIGLGGSGSNDGGVGALEVLGARFVDQRGEPIAPGAAGLARLASVDLRELRALPPDGVTVLSDVRNPLLGPNGAAAVFGPQKGATPRQIEQIEHGLGRLLAAAYAAGSTADPELPGAGSAGGTGYGLALWGATIASGAEMISDMNGLGEQIASSQLVITGEGQFDRQSIHGKLVGHVIDVAAAAGVEVAIVTGQRAVDEPSHRAIGATVALAELTSAPQAYADPQRWMIEAGRRLAHHFRPGTAAPCAPPA